MASQQYESMGVEGRYYNSKTLRSLCYLGGWSWCWWATECNTTHRKKRQATYELQTSQGREKVEWIGEVPSTQRRKEERREGSKGNKQKMVNDVVRWKNLNKYEKTISCWEQEGRQCLGVAVWMGNVPQRLMCLDTLSPVGDTVCGLGGPTVLKEDVHWGQVVRV